MRTSLLRLAALALASAATPAFAGVDVGGGVSISGNATLVSDYRFRGISLSDEDVAIQGGIDVTHDSGLYVGTWASSIDGGDVYGHTEVDLYGGYRREIVSGLTLDVGLLYYAYPDGDVGDAEYFEPYGSLTYSIGPATIETGFAYAWDQSALGDTDNLYVYSDVGVGIPGTPVTLTGHLGYTDGPLSLVADGDTIDWSLGGRASFGPVTVGLAYVDTDIRHNDLADATVVGSVGVSF
ncbi:MAG: hypothetical protein H7X93_03450 [Sphingomonadaceae bacterium]|nr:hypothetical protein [Sphingomonadaceae bacterium]